MSKKYKISIVTPNYNYENYIAETIESVLAQNYPYFEHIIVDDGSTDNSVEVIKKYVEKYPDKIKLIQQENAGQTPAINRGLKEVTGDIIGWINSDDTYVRNLFDLINMKFCENDEIDIIIGESNIVDLKGNYIYRLRHNKYRYEESALLGFGRTTTSNAIFWKRQLIEKAGYFKDELKANMDGEYFSRLFRDAKVLQVNKPFANFRKQIVSKAGEKNKNWGKVIKAEVDYEITNSMNYLMKSKKKSITYLRYIKKYYRVKRIVIKLFSLKYLFYFFEIIIYKIKHQSYNKFKN